MPPKKCRLCGAKLLVEADARICARRDGSDEGQWHDVFDLIMGEWVDITPVKPVDEMALLRERITALEKQLRT